MLYTNVVIKDERELNSVSFSTSTGETSTRTVDGNDSWYRRVPGNKLRKLITWVWSKASAAIKKQYLLGSLQRNKMKFV